MELTQAELEGVQKVLAQFNVVTLADLIGDLIFTKKKYADFYRHFDPDYERKDAESLKIYDALIAELQTEESKQRLAEYSNLHSCALALTERAWFALGFICAQKIQSWGANGTGQHAS